MTFGNWATLHIVDNNIHASMVFHSSPFNCLRGAAPFGSVTVFVAMSAGIFSCSAAVKGVSLLFPAIAEQLISFKFINDGLPLDPDRSWLGTNV